MPLNKSKGNMYPWVTHTHTHLGGQCSHNCSYCYVQATRRRFGGDRYAGPLRFIEDELAIPYGNGRIIFVEHCNDFLAADVPDDWIRAVLKHCNEFPQNQYVFQTKNPARYHDFLAAFPPDRLLGSTIETTDADVAKQVSTAPLPAARYEAMATLVDERRFITIEPILRGDMRRLARWVADIAPDFVNVGADSKGSALDEPTAGAVCCLLEYLAHVQIRQKQNLQRILKHPIP